LGSIAPDNRRGRGLKPMRPASHIADGITVANNGAWQKSRERA
jgi:hypothetical protein